MKILIATHNKAKLEEIKWGLSDLRNIEILSLEDFKIFESPEEDGETFRDNAYKKAKFYSEIAKIPTIADDGGLIIPYLNGEPGVKSRRWLGYEASDEELINHTLKKLKNVSGEERLAYLQTCVCFYDPHKEILILEEEKIEGYIAYEPSKKRIAGYPFRSLFIVKEFNKYYDELSEEEHFKINHRLQALSRLKEKIKDIYKI
ncbi:MAG: non-canonical purine NTP pyrophosphatase [Candidatus Pacearchaeota archaeon]